ncbi:hypothetical protein FNT36_02975 [Hymenobacter setariae]|uniref:Cathepsin propeptide inhibitor domain-containing protein n=1 Tax=Hymenobacter setariae TaxID=2594794 RepID=A0A558C2S1_9BACT|nr:hypothetical protein [Hymenobacter setariae]TVT43069.1 hypothetical protein FNT36_02975 [Hymenobacter setariae]
MRYLWKLLLFVPFLGFAQGETPAQANKKLFDRTIDELNFRTFETVYDKHFTRQKFPENLRTAAARRDFTNFENNAELQKLFLNYNGVAERYKTHFGGGSLSQAEFEKQLNAVVRDRNFEFFIRGLPRDERSALIRTEQRIIKQAVARFNASGETATANVPAADVEPEPAVASAPLTTNGTTDPEAAPAATPAAREPELRSPDAEAPSSGPGWVGYLTLLSSLATLGLGGFALLSVLPELRRLRRRVRELEDAGAQAPPYGETDLDAPDQEPAEARPSFLSRLRGPASGELLADNYGDDDDEPDPQHPVR